MTVGITELPPEGMLLPGVALAGDADRGTKTTEGISLLFTSAGITVQGPQPQIERLLVWTALDSATCREVVQLTDGRESAIMELSSGGQSIRFLLPTDTVSPGQAAYLDQALPTWLARYKGSAAPAAPVSVPAPPAAASTLAQGDAEVGVTLPAPGAAPTVAPDTNAPTPSFVTAGAVAAGAAAGIAFDRTGAPGNGNGSDPASGNAPGSPPTARFAAPAPPAPPLANPAANPVAPPAPPTAPPPAVAPLPPPAMQQSPPFAPAVQQPVPPPPAMQQSAPFAPPVPVEAPGAASVTPPPFTGWDQPPIGATEIDSTAAAKTPWYKLTARKPKAPADAVAVAATTVAATPAGTVDPATAATTDPNLSTLAAAPSDAKAPWYKLAPRAPKAATAAPSDAKAPWYKLAPRAPKAAVVASTSTSTPLSVSAPTADPAIAGTLAEAKKSRFALASRKSKAAAAGAVATGAAVGPSALAPSSAMAPATPTAPPSDPVPLAHQPLPPVMASPTSAPPAPFAPPVAPTAAGPIAPGQSPAVDASGGYGSSGAVLADADSSRSRRSRIALVVLLVVALVGGAGYVISKRNSSSSTSPPAPPSSASSTSADTALAGSINLRLSDLPAGWTEAPPAQAVVRPPVAPAVTQADATNTMASCLNTSYAIVSGLFDGGSLPNETSLVQSPAFLSAAGSSFEMGSKTMTMASTGEVQALNSVFTNPKFPACYQQYMGALAAGAVPGATVQVQPVTLGGPAGVQAYGIVSTYALPGAGTEVVGDAYMLGGRVVSILQPSTNGPAIDSSVFTPAFDAVAGRVATASK